MSFMRPQLTEDIYTLAFDCYGESTLIVGEHLQAEDCNDYMQTTLDAEIVEHLSGLLCRLSAPGYMDCTDWVPVESPQSAVQELLGLYGDTFDISDLTELASWLDSWDEFYESYKLAMMFTAHKEDGTGSGESLFPCQGEFTDSYSVDDFPALDKEKQLELLGDALEFYCVAYDMVKDDPARAGADFHYTRNGHGCGFWDSARWDADSGRKLTEMSKRYGTLELYGYVDDDGQLTYDTHN